MSETRPFPFGGVPVYNPQSLSKGEALAQFHARQNTYQRLIEILREKRPSHVLLIGTRGMGKTTLLQRVRYGVEDDSVLSSRYLVLTFPEEQYNVNRLSQFLLNTLDALADAVEKLPEDRVLARIEKFTAEAAHLGREGIEELVPKLLAEVGHDLKRDFLLLVDNADRLFETIEDREQWRLRELLSTRGDLTLFGATVQASEGLYGHERAFFEFFNIQRLTPLTLAEVKELLLRLSESVDEQEGHKGIAKQRVEQWLAADAARLRTLVQLTGGNPRTTVLLFNLVLDGLAGGAREYLEQLLDQCTPNYKGRVDELSPQAQQVLDAVALRWDPVLAMEVAADTGLDVGVISTNLTRLVRQGILEKADAGDSKKALYQIAERFFNIWYLMRASRRVRAKLRWFVEFLRVFFDSRELEQMAWERVAKFRNAGRTHTIEMETAFAYVLASGADRQQFETYLRRECAAIEADWSPYLDLIRGVAANQMSNDATTDNATNSLKGISTGDTAEDERLLRQALAVDPKNSRNSGELALLLIERNAHGEATGVLRRALEFAPASKWLWLHLGTALSMQRRHEEAEEAIKKAIELDPALGVAWGALGMVQIELTRSLSEAEATLRKSVELAPHFAPAWTMLGAILAHEPANRQEAEEAYRRGADLEPNSPVPWGCLAEFLKSRPEKLQDAEAASRKAIQLAPESAEQWNCLGDILQQVPDRQDEALTAYRKATELDPGSHVWWADLGMLAWKQRLSAEAEMAIRKAVDLKPNDAQLWGMLGAYLARTPKRLEEAEAALRRALSLDPTSSRWLVFLARFLVADDSRTREAEVVVRKAIELDPNTAETWNLLGDVLSRLPGNVDLAANAYQRAVILDPNSAGFQFSVASLLAQVPGRAAEAEAAMRKALDLDPKNGALWSLFGFILACRTGKSDEAETAFRKAVELDPDTPGTLRNLGVLLYCQTRTEREGIEYLRQAADAEPSNVLSAAILTSVSEDSGERGRMPEIIEAASRPDFWDGLLDLVENYPPFGKILARISDMLHGDAGTDRRARVFRAIALAQLNDFPRASVALDDALQGDPIDLLAESRNAVEVFLAAAAKNGRTIECLEVLDKKGWKDAWRPIYEALRAVEAGSAEYLKRIAVEIRDPAITILRRIAPDLRGLEDNPMKP